MGLSRTVSEIDGDFSRKSQNFPVPLYFAPPLMGFPGMGIVARGRKTRIMGLLEWEKKFDDIVSRLDAIHQRDGRTDSGREQTPRLRIASHGKNSTLQRVPKSVVYLLYSLKTWTWYS